jgi:DinB superfamily
VSFGLSECGNGRGEETLKNDKALREHLLHLLKGGGAHVSFEDAIKDLPIDLLGKRPKADVHSPWELVEHMRIAQWDIIEFVRNPKHVSPEFPTGYWPAPESVPSDAEWKKSVEGFRRDLRAVMDLAKDESQDLFAKIPHGDGQTILREILLVADHNAYHVGELVVVRRFLGAWHS